MSTLSHSLLESTLERMRSKGGRITQNKIRIIKALIDLDHPASAEEIREQANLPVTKIVTVYRNLEVLNEIGTLQRVPLENGTQLFELTAPGDHYHHLICRECHQAERLDVCLGEELRGVAEAHGYSKINHIMEVYGICEKCDSPAT